jgi:hypothetical protein
MLASRGPGTRKNTSLFCHYLSFNHFIDQTYDLACFSVPFRLEFGIDQLTVDADLEAAFIRWDKRYRFDQVLELLEQVTCQANGPVGVVSDSAINDLDLEHKPSHSLSVIPGLGCTSSPATRKLLRNGTESNVRKL